VFTELAKAVLRPVASLFSSINSHCCSNMYSGVLYCPTTLALCTTTVNALPQPLLTLLLMRCCYFMTNTCILTVQQEPFFTMLCGHLDLLPPDPARLPDRSDDFLARMALHLEGGGQRIPSVSSPIQNIVGQGYIS
jgi:hypothetical protein